jgi:VanZ family protein
MKIKVNFTSKKERNLWILALLVFTAIYTTLFLGGQLIDLMVERRIIEQGTFYLFLLLVLSFIVSGWKRPGERLGHWSYAGMLAVYGMALFRLDITTSERSHLFEYGLLSILVYEALVERERNGESVRNPVLISIFIAGTIGLIDECIQIFVPYRIFDFADIGFNYLASVFGVFTSIGVTRLKRIFVNGPLT